MHCRYCYVVYEYGATRCDGCGAPKSSIGQQVIDATTDKESYSDDFRKLLHRIVLFHSVVLVMVFSTTRSGSGHLSGLPAFITMLWIVPVSPSVLANAAWVSGRSNFPTRVVNMILALGVWLLFLLTIGIAFSF